MFLHLGKLLSYNIVLPLWQMSVFFLTYWLIIESLEVFQYSNFMKSLTHKNSIDSNSHHRMNIKHLLMPVALFFDCLSSMQHLRSGCYGHGTFFVKVGKGSLHNFQYQKNSIKKSLLMIAKFYTTSECEIMLVWVISVGFS